MGIAQPRTRYRQFDGCASLQTRKGHRVGFWNSGNRMIGTNDECLKEDKQRNERCFAPESTYKQFHKDEPAL